MKRSKFFTIVIVIALILGAGAFFIRYRYGLKRLISGSNQVIIDDSNIPSTPNPIATKSPASLLLKVPFTAQAPTANWDEEHNEDCEEATSLMAAQYFSGNQDATIPAATAEKELTKLNDWERTNLGYNLDTDSAETAKMIEQVYGLHTKLVTDFSSDDLKNQLNQNHLIIISEAGQKLGNPNYKQPGPVHHMLIIKGYTAEGFITNDSGTRNGKSYFYTFKTLYNAAADWDHSINTVNPDKKVAIEVWK